MHNFIQLKLFPAPNAYPEGNSGYPEQQGMANDLIKQPMGLGVQGINFILKENLLSS